MSCDLRPARPTDAGRIGAILSGFVDDTPWMPRVHSRAQDLAHAGELVARGWVTVAETAGDVIGFCARHEDTIHALYVTPAQRGQGHGSALLDAMKAARPALTLWVFQANTAAQAFYRRHGFCEDHRTDGAGNDEGLPDIRFTWERGN